jgi:hypothetical protein
MFCADRNNVVGIAIRYGLESSGSNTGGGEILVPVKNLL